MMDELFVDLHIHSCLSPCADDDMTPQNVCGMAALKGLRMIAVTDHNSALNLPYFERAARENDLVLIPGIELTTKEEVHLLGYFKSVPDAVAFGAYLRAHLPKTKNTPSLFGRQLIMDEHDQVLGEEDALLIGATDIPLCEAVQRVRAVGGVPVPAHINRGSNGILMNLGFLPPDLHFSAVEVWRGLPCPDAPKENRRVLHSSDAHRLGDILEAEFSLPLKNRTIEAFLQFIENA